MAGTRKKEKLTKRKSTKAPEKKEIQELDGWNVGDTVWATVGNNEIVNGTISSLHNVDQIMNGESHGYAATLITVPDSKYRVALLSSLTFSKPKRPRVKRAKKK